MKKIALLVLLSTLFFSYTEAQVHTTFEMRYITSDSKADGETDFTGESEWMSLDQRIDFLNKYAAFASGFMVISVWINLLSETEIYGRRSDG